MKCEICGQDEEITEVAEVEIDGQRIALCLHCQPCPYCGRFGDCDDEQGPSGCRWQPS